MRQLSPVQYVEPLDVLRVVACDLAFTEDL